MQRRVVDHDDVGVVADAAHPGREALDLRRVRGAVVAVGEVLAGLALERVVVARDAQPGDRDDRTPVGGAPRRRSAGRCA